MRSTDLALIAATRADLASGRARHARVSAKLSQHEVASVLGVTRAAVGHWEAGRHAPCARLALAYGKLLRTLAQKAA
jgi:DNA-binding XRE family transcriptional regulator